MSWGDDDGPCGAVGDHMELVSVEKNVSMPVEPLFAKHIWGVIEELCLERKKAKALEKAGLRTSSKVLFKGPPGVGKTLAARYLARALQIPLVTMDLSTIVNCYLGETNKNIRRIFDYGEKAVCVFFMDEIDSVAVSRSEHSSNDGEMRRVVNALLQRMDRWTGKSIMLAATNEAQMIDPAVLRRFDHTVAFPMPDHEQIEQLVFNRLKKHKLTPDQMGGMASALDGESYAAVDLLINRALRRSVVTERPLGECVERVMADYAAN